MHVTRSRFTEREGGGGGGGGRGGGASEEKSERERAQLVKKKVGWRVGTLNKMSQD